MFGTTEIEESVFCINQPTDIFGAWDDLGDNVFGDECECPDVNADGLVNVADLLAIIATWGSC
ncbi:MAG: hypothetical protein P8I74_06335, partial [Phycisphaerales bacterium]|nr:hypothetical protein [Phycisphaerales bacterium]